MTVADHVTFPAGDTLYQALKARVDEYFSRTGRSKRDVPRMYLKTAIILTWFAASYALLVFFAAAWWQAIPLAISLGFSMAAVGFNIQHDGNHKAYSKHAWINRMMAMSLDLLGGSSYIWNHKHNSIHHTYANIDHQDDDINMGLLGRLAPPQRRIWLHRFQHFYLWLLYGFMPMKWQLFDDFRDLKRGRIGEHRFQRPKGWDLVALVCGKVVSLSLAFVLPLFFHPLLAVVFFYVLACWTNGVLICVVFQLAHVVDKAEFPAPNPATNRMDRPWAVHQVETTVDFSRNNRVLTWFLGGLNFQVEHHLFPRISHIHYPALSKLVAAVCREQGYDYRVHRSVFDGVASHFRWLRRMGQPDSAAAV